MLWLKVLFFFSLLALIIVFVTYISKRDMVDDDEEEPIEYGSLELIPVVVDITGRYLQANLVVREFCIDNSKYEIRTDGKGGVYECLSSLYDKVCDDLYKEISSNRKTKPRKPLHHSYRDKF